MAKKKKEILITVLALMSLVVITVGVTYAFFNYAKEGLTENCVTTGTITFLYTEVSGVGKGISLTDAYPISDSIGKVQVGEGNIFDFKVTSTTPNKTSIPYEVTARKKSNSTLDESAVKLYLTEVSGTDEEEVLLDNYSNLTQTSKIDVSKYTEKTIYQGKVPANSNNYEQSFRLRMWIDDKTDFSPNEDGTYPYNGKTFIVTVNVYANAKVVTEEDVVLESNVNISSLSVGDNTLTLVEGQDYDYEVKLPEGTTSTTIHVETESPYATVNVERIDSLAYQESSIKKLSTKKTIELNPGDNYFKVTVTSENKEVTKEYKLKISLPEIITIFGKQYPVIDAKPTLTTSSNNTSDASGLYKSTATNTGKPTYYFRGNVENNYVSFAGQIWRIIRINEDGTIRMIMANGINNDATYKFNAMDNNESYMYYTNSDVKTKLESWYETNIASNDNYASKVASGNYFCEQAKVTYNNSYVANSEATMTVYSNYIPDFKCTIDENGKGLVNTSIGLITYDEVVFAGGYYDKSNSNYYLYNNKKYWTMGPGGFSGSYVAEWCVGSNGRLGHYNLYNSLYLNAVINLKADTIAMGEGTSANPFKVLKNGESSIYSSLKDRVMENKLVEAEPTLTTSSNNTNDASGLYKSTATNSGNPTYYFRGNVENNYVSFAGFTWRIIRINEDGTIRIIMANGINDDTTYQFNSKDNDKSYMYYTNSQFKTNLEDWYQINIIDKGYGTKVSSGNYFCEQAKVALTSTYISESESNMVLYSNYTPDFKCSTDKNGKGIVNASVGLINYDEVVYAGGYYDQSNQNYFLYNDTSYWTMSTAGFDDSNTYIWLWYVRSTGAIGYHYAYTYDGLHAVINLKADTIVWGEGTKFEPYVVQ